MSNRRRPRKPWLSIPRKDNPVDAARRERLRRLVEQARAQAPSHG